jgi:8-oxo-dGTP pyrophosphatase MutT (NUDIX family)
VLEGLAREVTEETGLVVQGWLGPLYRVQVAAPGLGWDLKVEVHAATAFEGELVVDDPDGIVVDARFVGLGDHVALLAGNHPWVAEPLVEWVDARWEHGEGSPTYRYVVEGERLGETSVTRHG